MAEPSRILLIGAAAQTVVDDLAGSPFGPFEIARVAAAPTDALTPFDVALLDAAGVVDAAAACTTLSRRGAVLVVAPGADAPLALAWLQAGADDLLAPEELLAPSLALRLRAAIERWRRVAAVGEGWATDLTTGLPHRRQLVEHLSQLLALREREPVPMAVVALRIEGFATAETRLGLQSADLLRRKVAVRLRGAVRASDVVAAIDEDTYGVLLGALLTPGDGERVAAKLARLLMEPFSVGGDGVGVAAAVGLALYPEDGTQPDELLRKAIGMAIDAPALGRVGLANFEETGPGEAANDP